VKTILAIDQSTSAGAMARRASAGPLTFARVSTDDRHGQIRTYTGEGQLTDDPLDTFGHRAVACVPDLQSLMKYICKNGFEHHVAMTMGCVAEALDEAFTTYMGWENYHHVG
jgi:L-fucose isomerase-like protein